MSSVPVLQDVLCVLTRNSKGVKKAKVETTCTSLKNIFPSELQTTFPEPKVSLKNAIALRRSN